MNMMVLPSLLLFSLQILTHIEAYGSKVKVLPGFQGPLPFELETGSTILIIPFSISLLFYENLISIITILSLCCINYAIIYHGIWQGHHIIYTEFGI
jgi:archaellum biogenesis protein FlaJ (TadC family)